MDEDKMKGAISFRKEEKGYEIRFVGGSGGSGTRLIEKVIDLARKDGGLTVYVEARMNARSYFEKMKFSLREGTSNIFEFRTSPSKTILQSEMKGCLNSDLITKGETQ
jgi:N-acetylglutamate synthase-like GNAT family acetyltransferase